MFTLRKNPYTLVRDSGREFLKLQMVTVRSLFRFIVLMNQVHTGTQYINRRGG